MYCTLDPQLPTHTSATRSATAPAMAPSMADLSASIANSIGTSIAQWADNKARELLDDVGDLADIDTGAA